MGKSTILAINSVAVVALLLSYLATVVSPERWPYLALFGIGYAVSLVVNIGFVIFWLIAKKRLALISGIAILIGFNHLTAYFQFIPSFNSPVQEGKTIKVLSHNVKLFGWYNWRTNIKDRDKMIKNLEGIDADVLCFQEFFHHSGADIFETKEPLRRILRRRYMHEVFTTSLHGNQHYGIATLSKYPIVNKGIINFAGEGSNVCIFTDIYISGDTVRIYNAHVASIRFSSSEYDFIEKLKSENGDDKPELKDGVPILKRLSRAYKRRAAQVNTIREHMANSPHPVIFCGDLNDTPVSYSYNRISNDFTDAFGESGWGIGNTYIGSFPSFRIDYIFHDPSMTSHSYETHPEEVSDHHAISCEIVLPEKAVEIDP
jgi:endonuclease/exonuclease/phosphatase family metal-dependent hydrolase